ncbi:hypothetical protein ILYODFUR_010274 [Ilyodon furcidens]|uniref:Uncharacterized protein n=1 Tax=Ilyodon furcidens TaxID=33524 RepID=A0ABV0VDD0_9TELE
MPLIREQSTWALKEWKPRGRCQLVVSLSVKPPWIFFSPVSTRVMFRGLRKLKPRRLCIEPPSASNSEPRFLGDPFIKPLSIIHLPVHPPTAFPNRSGEYWKRETQNHRSEERILP